MDTFSNWPLPTCAVRAFRGGKAKWKPPHPQNGKSEADHIPRGLVEIGPPPKTRRVQGWFFPPRPLSTHQGQMELAGRQETPSAYSGSASECSCCSRCGFFAGAARYIWLLFSDQSSLLSVGRASNTPSPSTFRVTSTTQPPFIN